MPARSLRGLDDLDRAALGVDCSRAFRISGLRLDRFSGSTATFQCSLQASVSKPTVCEQGS